MLFTLALFYSGISNPSNADFSAVTKAIGPIHDWLTGQTGLL